MLKSVCCNAKVKLKDKETLTYVCSKCDKSCQIYVSTRKTWKRNPATQIIPDKRKKIKKLFTDKELRGFRMNEDF